MRANYTFTTFRSRAVAALAAVTLALTSQSLIAVSASAVEADSASSSVDYAGVFDGSTLNTVNAAAATVIPSTGSFTAEAWVYPTAATSDIMTRVIFSQGTGLNGGEFWVGRAGGNIKIYDPAGSAYLCGPVPTGAWSHIAVSRSATTINCYINGSLAFTKSGAFTTNIGPGFAVGSWTPVLTDANTFWQGQLDQVKVWSGVLTDTQLSQSMHDYAAANVTTPPTLVAHYDFNEGTNTDQRVYNRAGANLDLTSSSALTYSDIKTVVTGGNIDSNRTVVYKFPRTYLTSQGGWAVPDNIGNVEVLTVGAGGGGGENVGNGGSGGSSTYHSGLTLTAGSILGVKVGQGGRPGVFVDDTMVGSTSTIWQTDAAGTNNVGIASTQRDGGDGQSSSVTTDSATLIAPGGLGGMTYWDNNMCNGGGGATHAAANTPAGAAGTGGTTNAVGGAGGQGILAAASTTGVAAATTYTISGSGTKFGGGGAGAEGSGTSIAGGTYGGGSTSAVAATRGGDGIANSGGGGSGGLTSCTAGGAGGSGVVYVRTLPVSVSAISGGASSTKSLAAILSGPSGAFSVALSSTVGTFNILTGDLTASGATKTAGTGSEKFITYQGTIAQLRAAVAATKFVLNGAPILGSIKVELNPVVADTTNIFYNAANGHYYKYVSGSANYSTAAASAANTANNLVGLNGYLANLTSAAEQTFQASVITFASKPTVWIGARELNTNGNWVWGDGPEVNTQFLSGNYPSKTAVNGAYNNFNPTEPNNNSADTVNAADCAVGNFTIANDWDDVACSSLIAGAIVEFGGRTTDPGVATALVTVTLAQVNVAYTELNFDYTAGHFANLKKLAVDGADATLAGSTVTTTDSTGKNIGDRVLFKAVTVRDGKTIDAIVTTRRIVSAVVKNYEAGTSAGGIASSFQADVDINAVNAYAEFQFDFFETDANIVANCNAAVACTGSNKVILQNVNVSIFDIDYYQWNDVTGMDSYTTSSPTNVKACLVSGLTSTTTCTANNTISTFPNEIRYQGPNGIDATLPEDMVIANYGSLETFRIKFGRSIAGTPNWYGITFKALPWGGKATTTVGPPAANYDLVYNGNGKTGGTVPATQSAQLGAQVTVAAAGTLVRTGYTFGGWNTAADGSGTAYAAASTMLMPVNGLTLYATWIPSQFTLTYNANGGSSAPALSTNNAGAALTLSATAPTRAGYTFGGWNTLADGTGTNYASNAAYTMPGVNTTLYAKWTSATSTIAYNANSSTSGTAPSSGTGTAGAATTVSGNTGTLARTGYTFAGWNTAADGSGTDYAASAAINYPASGTTTLYAKWTAVAYTVAYNSNGGSSAPGSSSALYASTVTVVSSASNPTRAGYTFAGWNTAANGSGTSQAAASTFSMPASNVTLYAQWTAINYNVTYSGNAPSGQTAAGSQSDSANYNAGATITVLNAGTLAVTGYRFVGWNTAADGTGTDYIAAATFAMPVGGVALYAKWVLSSVRLTYDSNGGAAGPGADTHTAGSTINLSSTVPTRAGYTFAGWNTAANGGGTNYASNASYVIPGSDTILYAKWTAINYTLSYVANGGSGAPADVINQIVNNVITLSNTIPTWIGYTFLGWNTAANGTGTDYSIGSLFTMPASDFSLFAKWQGNAFTLFYNGNSGGTISPNSVARTAGSVGNIASSLPTRAGYTFAGWNTAANGTGTAYTAGSSLTMPGSNVTLYAQWTLASSAVNYDANGGANAPAGTNATIGQSVTVSSGVPTRTGYTFTGWNTAANASGTPYSATDVLTMGSSSITLYAQWTTSAYSLTYDANNGSAAPGIQNYTYAATATVSSVVPTRAGYDFLGWNTQADGLGTPYSAASTFAMPASNVVLYAQWTLATYTVYYNANGGNGVIANQAGRYNANINLTAATPTRAGYTFAGWNTAAAGTGTAYAASAAFTIPAANTIMFAQWTALTYTLTYDANTGNGAPSTLTGVTSAQNVTLSANAPTRSGYYFTGWNTALNGSGQNYAISAAFVMPAANATLYAQWTLNTYNVSYNANGGSGAPGAQQTDGSGNVTVPGTTPTRPGYTFVTWNTQVGGGGTNRAQGANFAPSGNLVLYAQWTPNTITVSYDMNGGNGTTPPNSVGTYGTTLQLEGFASFSKANAVFVSWNTVADGSGINYQSEEPSFALPDSDITLYAIWSGTNYAIEYNANGGSNEPGTQFATPGNNVNIPPAEPVREGYVFGGWQEVSTGNVYGTGAGLTMPTSNVVMVARWFGRASVRGVEPTATPTPTPSPTETKPPVVAPKKLTITVYFKGDSAVLTAATKTALKKLAKQAKALGKATKITIIGRVKETNDKSYDMRLSKQRAINVSKYLKQLGVAGNYSVIAAGISPENKAVSRRVDGVLVWK